MKGPDDYKNLYDFMVATDQFPGIRSKQRKRCLDALSERPMTCDECRIALKMVGSSAVSARFSELEYDGWICETGQERLTTNGGLGRVMRRTTHAEMLAILYKRAQPMTPVLETPIKLVE